MRKRILFIVFFRLFLLGVSYTISQETFQSKEVVMSVWVKNFRKHIQKITEKTGKAIMALGRLTPNMAKPEPGGEFHHPLRGSMLVPTETRVP